MLKINRALSFNATLYLSLLIWHYYYLNDQQTDYCTRLNGFKTITEKNKQNEERRLDNVTLNAVDVYSVCAALLR